MTVEGEVGSTKVKMLTVVDGRGGRRVESKTVKVLLLPVEEERGFKKTKLLTTVDGMEGGWVNNLKNVDSC